MNKIKLTIFIALLIIFSFLGIKKFIHFGLSREKIDEKNLLKDSYRNLNSCFDLKNKNQRSLNKSNQLIEYCLKEYGSKTDFKILE